MKPRALGRAPPAGGFVGVANVCFINDFTIPARTVVVTGATSGLGRACAAALARRPGWTVVVAARDAARGERTAGELRSAGRVRSAGEHGAGGEDRCAPAAVALPLDLADLASVRAFPGRLAAAGLPPLHGLVANAGVQYRDRRHVTADGFEATFGVNHLGHFLLLWLLVPALAADGRVVIVASGTHKDRRVRNLGFPPPRWEDPRALAAPGAGSGQVAYATSKLANVMTMLELDRRMASLRPGARIAVHGLDPGLMPATGLDQDYPPAARRVYAALAPAIAAVVPGATTPERAGDRLAAMVADPAFAAPGGRYVEVDRDGVPSALARDRARAQELWEASQELVGLP